MASFPLGPLLHLVSLTIQILLDIYFDTADGALRVPDLAPFSLPELSLQPPLYALEVEIVVVAFHQRQLLLLGTRQLTYDAIILKKYVELVVALFQEALGPSC